MAEQPGPRPLATGRIGRRSGRRAPNHHTTVAIAAQRAWRSTFVCFAGLGVTFATWASEIPRIKDHEQLSAAALGVLLLTIAGGSVCALPLSGLVVNRIRSDRAVASAGVSQGLALVLVGIGYEFSFILLVLSLVLFGFAMGIWDVAVNVQGAAIERATGRAVLPRFHAGFSIGTVAGALLGAASIALRIPPPIHLGVLGCLVIAIVPVSTRAFMPDAATEPMRHPPGRPARKRILGQWTDRRTLLIGLAVLGFAFAEGTGNDWISVGVISGYQVPAALGSLTFAIFLGAMTVIRWYGPHLLDRFGRVPVLRWLAAAGISGLLLFALGPNQWTAFIGAAFWGAGASLGFPVGISAAADDAHHAAQRVSVVVSMGYSAFLVGPPLIGFIGDQITVHRAVLVVAGLLTISVPLVAAFRPASPHQ